MNTSYAMDSYKAHDLNIEMRTSSGDKINLDFANHQSASMKHSQNENGSSTQMSFSSMQSFQFNIQTNGIDAQDQKEIDAFMEIAQPFIDSFLQELENSAPKSPVSKLAHQIAAIFDPNKDRNENAINHVKTNMVDMFDRSMEKLQAPETSDPISKLEDIFKETQKLLEKTLQEFDEFNKNLYA